MKNPSTSRTISRDEIIAAAHDWLKTPYLHQSSVKGQGTDCLGLIRGLWRDIYGEEPVTPPPYTPDWNERHGAHEPLLSAARQHLVPCAQAQPGSVLIFRVVKDGPAKHCGVLVSTDKFIHAYAGREVMESWLSRWWRARIVSTFDFPGAE